MLAAHPGFVRNGLDGLHSDIALLAGREQRLEVFGVIGVLHRDVVVRKQYRIKVEAFETAPVHSGNLQTMTGDADGPYQPLFPGLNSRIESTTGTQGRIPFNRIRQAMQLPQIHIIDAHAFQGAMEFLFCFLRCTSVSLRRYIEL